MSGRAPQRPPSDAIRIRPGDRTAEAEVLDWLDLNGFPFFVVGDTDLRLDRDGRTIYGTRFLVKRDEHGYARLTTAPRCWDYQVTADGTDLRRRTFAYPIVRPLTQYAPELAQRLGLTKETR